jgi:hypothetical protein
LYRALRIAAAEDQTSMSAFGTGLIRREMRRRQRREKRLAAV